ncbi:hypothetical protein GCM10022221_68400 [Actinocorallia aurea]
MPFQTRIVTGRFANAQGLPAAGTVTFTPSMRLRDFAVPAGIVNGPASTTLGPDGTFRIALIPTDAGSVVPPGWHYHVVEQINGHHRIYDIVIPSGTGPLNLADLAPIPDDPDPIPSSDFLRVDQLGIPGGVAVLGPDGIVPYTLLPDLSAFVPATRAISAGPGLAGGGALDQDRTLSVVFGTTAGTAAAGNDPRLSDARPAAAGSVTDGSVAADAAIALSKLAVDPRARATHTGTQTAATISNFDAAVRTNRLDQLAAPIAPVPFGGQRITGLAAAAAATDAVTKQQLDDAVANVTVDLPWLTVTDFGAVGDDVADDIEAFQAAVDALPPHGGIIWIPPGTYRLTAALILRSNVTFLGAGTDATVLHQVTTTAHGLAGVDVHTITLRDLQIKGPGSGTGTGLTLTRDTEDNVRYIRLDNVYIRMFGQDGIEISNGIVSSFDQVRAENNNRHGFYLHGVVGGAAGTSLALSGCYGNTNGLTGFTIVNMAYLDLSGCASEGHPINFALEACQGVALTGCGSELVTAGGTGFKVTGGFAITFTSCWDLTNRGRAYWITGGAYCINLVGIAENTPGAGAVASLQVDAGCTGVNLHGIAATSPLALAPTTTNILNDGANGLTIHGYLYTDGMSEFNGPVIFDQAVTHYGTTTLAGDPTDPLHAATKAYVDAHSAAVTYGTTAGTAAQGNDSRIVGAAQKASNLSDLASAATARTNLGLGGAAVLNVGTTAGTVAAGNDSRLPSATTTPRLRLDRVADLTLTTGVVTAVPGLAAAYQIGGTWWTAGANMVVPPGATGLYLAAVRAIFKNAGANTGERSVWIRKLNGGALVDDPPIVAMTTTAPGGAIWPDVTAASAALLTAGETYYVSVRQSLGADVVLYGIEMSFTRILAT